MGKILEIQTFRAVFSNNVLVNMAAIPNDSLIVKNGKEASLIRCIALWAKTQLAPGLAQVVSPLLHDSTRGFRFRTIVDDPENMIPLASPLPLKAQDNLTVQVQVADAAADEEYLSMLNMYDDFENVEANLIDHAELMARIKMLTTVEDTSGATAINSYSGQRLITAGSDLLHANTEYALLGAEVGVVCHALTVIAPDFANFRVGIPGNAADRIATVNFFDDLAVRHNIPCIPVFNSANKGNIMIHVVQDENAAVVPFTLFLAELNPK